MCSSFTADLRSCSETFLFVSRKYSEASIYRAAYGKSQTAVLTPFQPPVAGMPFAFIGGKMSGNVKQDISGNRHLRQQDKPFADGSGGGSRAPPMGKILLLR